MARSPQLGGVSIKANPSARFYQGTNLAITANTTVNFATTVFDNFSGYSAGVYTTKKAGYYLVLGSLFSSGTSLTTYARKNGSNYEQGAPLSNANQGSNVVTLMYCDVGDTIDIISDTSATLSGSAILNTFSVQFVGE